MLTENDLECNVGIFVGNSGIRKSLVFAYDLNNIKSYVGPAIENKATGKTPYSEGTGTGYSFVVTYEDKIIPQIGKKTVTRAQMQNDYPTSGQCCPAPIAFGSSIPLIASTQYTYAIVYKVDSGYTNGNYMYRYEYNGAVYVTEAGVHDDTKRIALGDGWWWAWNTFTTQSNTTILTLAAAFYYLYPVTYTDNFYIADVLIAHGDHTMLHPKYWAAPGTARANTAVLFDLTGNLRITANSLTYGSGNVGNVTFNGTNNTISFNTVKSYSNYTISLWVKMNTLSGEHRLYSNDGVGTFTIRWTGSDFTFHYNPLDGSPGSVNTSATGLSVSVGVWYNLVATNSANTLTSGGKLYVNGDLRGTEETAVALPAAMNNVGSNNGTALYSNATISAVMIYSTELSPEEVKVLYNGSRKRFGL